MEKRALLSAAIQPIVLGLPSNTTQTTVAPVATPDLIRSKPVPVGQSLPDSTTPTGAGGFSATAIRGAYGVGKSAAGMSYNISFNGVQGDGTGQTIALIDYYNDPDIAIDLATFDTAEGLPSPPSFQVLNQSGQTSPLPSNSPTSGSSDWSAEESLDVEWSHAIAPGANIIVFECSSSLLTANVTAASYAGGVVNGVTVAPVSVVSNSWGQGESQNDTQTQLGSPPLDNDFLTPSGHTGVSFFASTGDSGAEISYPAESVNVVAVGGTTLGVSNYAWTSESAWSSGGGGTSAYDALQSWQKGVVATGKREDPDVSLDANPNSGVPVCDSWDTSGGQVGAGSSPWVEYGGTSLSSPMFAGMVAIADQGRVAEGLGTLTSTQTLTRLYQMTSNGSSTSIANYHDITSGSNGHSAVTGYDEATGIGTAIGNSLIPDLAGAGSITGTAYVDNNKDGVYDAGDTPLAGQTVYLDLNGNGKLDTATEPSVTTNSQGVYTFTDEPAGGKVVMSSAAPTGDTLTSASTVAIAYGATDTVNFVYSGPVVSASQLAITQQPPSSTPYGTALSPVIVSVESSTGTVVTTDTSTVTLTLSSGTFGSSGTNTATAAAVNGVATFNGLTITSAGSYHLTATDGSLSSATSNTFSITQVTPTISWTGPASITYGTALSTTQLDATASVPGTFVYTPASGTVLGAGASQALSVTFNPTDSTDYTSANGSASITVLKATPSITWANPSSITYGTALGASQLDASANVPGAFVYTPAAGTVLGAGSSQNLSAVFTPTDSVDYASVNSSASITVLQATPSVTWANPDSITYGTALSSTQLDATANVPGTFVYTPGAGAVLGAGAGQTLSTVFTPTDSVDYTSANGSASITVAQATPAITWANPASIAYPTPLGSTQLDATANVPGTFVYTPSAGTVLTPGANQLLSTTFTPTDSVDYTTATGSASITVTGVVTSPVNLTGSTFYLKLDSSSPQNLDIWTNSSATGTPAQVTEFDTISSITLTANAAGDSFTADFSNGTVVPTGGLTFNGFGAASGNSLTIVGSGGADTVTVPGDGTAHLNSQVVNYSGTTVGNVYFASGGSAEALTVPTGTVTLAPSSTSSIGDEVFTSISIASGAKLVAPFAGNHSARLLVETAALSLAGSVGAWTAALDLSNNDLDVAGGDLSQLSDQVRYGYASGTAGILSSAAQSDPTALTTLGVIQNSADGTPTGTALYGTGAALGTFDGASPVSTDVLIKYTYYGDANLDGSVDGSDYSRIDGASSTATGWYNGDFNYDKFIDGSDYTLIDNAYNQQGASLAAQIAGSSKGSTKQATTAVVTPVFSSTPITIKERKAGHRIVDDIGLAS